MSLSVPSFSLDCTHKKALQSKGLLSVNTAEYIKENHETVDICAKIPIHLTVLITQWERL